MFQLGVQVHTAYSVAPPGYSGTSYITHSVVRLFLSTAKTPGLPWIDRSPDIVAERLFVYKLTCSTWDACFIDTPV